MLAKLKDFLTKKSILITLYVSFVMFSIVTLAVPCFPASLIYFIINVLLFASLHLRLYIK